MDIKNEGLWLVSENVQRYKGIFFKVEEKEKFVFTPNGILIV